jgi:hypothetical protein
MHKLTHDANLLCFTFFSTESSYGRLLSLHELSAGREPRDLLAFLGIVLEKLVTRRLMGEQYRGLQVATSHELE